MGIVGFWSGHYLRQELPADNLPFSGRDSIGIGFLLLSFKGQSGLGVLKLFLK
jgi:hypothetical protein